MLSRVAECLFWTGRYIERAENIARLVDAARRMSALPAESNNHASNEWASVLIAAGAHEPFKDDLENVDANAAIDRLIFDLDNPSSVWNCLNAARENARAIRFAFTQEVWEALNAAWLEMRSLTPANAQGSRLPELLDWIKAKSASFRGTMYGTMLRNDGYYFLDMGMSIERTDSTARLLDVKYHVLLPSVQDVGQSTDHYQWLSLLQAAGGQRAYYAVTKSNISARGVAEFPILNPHFPRSLLYNLRRAEGAAANLEQYYNQKTGFHDTISSVFYELGNKSIDDIISTGLHEFLTDVINRNYRIANLLGDAYGFSPSLEEGKGTDDASEQ